MARTVLFDRHIALGAKMVDFHGWEMPVQYKGILAEHLAVRQNMGVFDVSHMGEFMVEGAEASAFLNFVSSNDLDKMELQQVIYTTLLNEQGGIVDDCTIYKIAQDKFLLVVNAANIDKDFQHLKRYQAKFKADLSNVSDEYGLIALQGPNAPLLMQKLVREPLAEMLYYRFATAEAPVGKVLLSRLGYTGEDGFEILVKNSAVEAFWDKLFELGNPFHLEPIGLGARDTLRLEAGYALYGQDLSDDTTPLEANLGWVLKLGKENFLGKESLQSQKQQGVGRKLIAFRYTDKGVPRNGYAIWDAGKGRCIGRATSGTYSPILRQGIGLGYVDIAHSAIQTLVHIEQSGNFFPAQIVKAPFLAIDKPHYPKIKK